jgi:hypothetical protein
LLLLTFIVLLMLNVHHLSLLPSVHCVLLLPTVTVIMFNVHHVVDVISLIVLLLFRFHCFVAIN